MYAYRIRVAHPKYPSESFQAVFLTGQSKEAAVKTLTEQGWVVKSIAPATADDMQDLKPIDELRSEIEAVVERKLKEDAERQQHQRVAARPITPMPPPPPPPPAAPFHYKMVQVPPTISLSQERGGEAAAYLQSVVNAHVREGWEFYRIDPITVHIPAGCLAALFGGKAEYLQYHVITFRRPT